VTKPIAEDFAAIRARLLAIRAAERPGGAVPAEVPPAPCASAGPVDFYGWLMSGRLWAAG
jgi:hypothetical protein